MDFGRWMSKQGGTTQEVEEITQEIELSPTEDKVENTRSRGYNADKGLSDTYRTIDYGPVDEDDESDSTWIIPL